MFIAEQTAPLSFEHFAPDHERWARALEASTKAAEPREASPAFREESSPASTHLTFPAGLYGFGSYRTFVLAEVDGSAALVAVDDLTVRLSVMDAALAVSGYPLAEAQAAAGMTGEEAAVALVVVRPANGGPMMANLRAPIVIGLTTRRGVQVILGDDLPLSAAL